MSVLLGLVFGTIAYLIARFVIGGFYTVQQNERAVITSFGRAQRIGDASTLDLPIAEHLTEDHRTRYNFPQLRVKGPGLYFKKPWQKVHKADVAIRTVNVAYDPENPHVNQGNTILEAVTKDQMNIGVTGQLRYKVSEQNLYAFLFGVKNPIAHVMGYFVSILRERIANFDASRLHAAIEVPMSEDDETAVSIPVPIQQVSFEGVSINDLRKNLNELNDQMDRECLSSAARYGIVLDASLITGIDPPHEIESALAAINTAHNEVSADLSIAQALADQKIEESKRAVEIETMRAQAEVQPLLRVSEQLRVLKSHGQGVLEAYRRNVRLGLLKKARRLFLPTEGGKGGAK